jgi:hypothetical protein
MTEQRTPAQGYRWSKVPNDLQKEFRKVVPPRRGFTVTLPGMEVDEYLAFKDHMLTVVGSDHLVGCVTAEMADRPIPHVFESARLRPLTEMFEKHAGDYYRYLFKQAKPHPQTYRRVARMGAPYSSIPDQRER